MTNESIRHLTISINRLSQLMEKQLSQREEAMQQWREANPKLSKRCKQAATIFNNALEDVLEEALDLAEGGDLNSFLLGDFIDRFGPRLLHLNNMIQIFVQLGG